MSSQFNRELEVLFGSEDLDNLLMTRWRMREMYTFLTDAFNLTDNPVFLEYRSLVENAGKQINIELMAWIDRATMSHGSYPDEK